MAYFGLFGLSSDFAGEEDVKVHSDSPETAIEESPIVEVPVPLDDTNCAICQDCEPKYRCPGCSLRTCSLVCVNEHKKKYSCDGRKVPGYRKLDDCDDQTLHEGKLTFGNENIIISRFPLSSA